MPEPLEAHDVMDVLPDDARDGATGHESHDDDAFAFHRRRQSSSPGAMASRRRSGSLSPDLCLALALALSAGSKSKSKTKIGEESFLTKATPPRLPRPRHPSTRCAP